MPSARGAHPGTRLAARLPAAGRRAATLHHTAALDTASVKPHHQTMIVKPNRDRRAERHEAIRREILDAAWDAAHETSIAGLTLRDIATRVEIGRASSRE